MRKVAACSSKQLKYAFVSLIILRYTLPLGSDYFCWFVILIDSTFKMDKNYYTQVFLKECN